MPRIIGYRKNGAPIWLVQGGSEDAGSVELETDAGDDESGSSGPDASSEEGESEGSTGQDSGGSDASDSASSASKGSKSQASKGVDGSSEDKGGREQGAGQDDISRLQAALRKERQDRKSKEQELAALRRQHASAEERALLEAKETARTETEGAMRDRFLPVIAAAKLQAAGVQGVTSRLVGLLDMKQVDVDEDGLIVGLDEQIDSLKDEFPNLFAVANGRPPAGNANSGSGSRAGRTADRGGDGKPKPWYEQLADQVLNPQGLPGTSVR